VTTYQAPKAPGSQVRCTFCGGTYDLQDVEVVARYADCSVFTTPCCARQVDDRRWVSCPAFREVTVGPTSYGASW
jgi:hypothetical protein